jgi:hypothetical protein
MSLIVAGRFTTFEDAEKAAAALFAKGFVEEDVTLFFVNPRGQHARFPIGGDENKDPASTEAPKGAGKGVAIGATLGAVIGVGIFVLMHASLLILIIAAGVGAYVGSLVGAMSQTREHGKSAHARPIAEPPVRESGVLLAVHVGPDNQAKATETLLEHGGLDVERATGRWQQGRWSDFDPLKAPVHPQNPPGAYQNQST